MTLQRSKFRFIDRGFDKTILLIPGWGLDYRIFDSLELKYNYLVALFVWPEDFVSKVKNEIENLGIKEISILGHSMGGFLGVDFALMYPQKLDELVCVGIRKRYSEKDMAPVRVNLRKNAAAFIYKMYDQSFSSSERDLLSWFKANLLKRYIKELDSKALNAGLDYLLKSEIRPEGLENIKLRFIHGEDDAIAPISEALDIASHLPNARFDKVKGGGHMLLLRKDFNSIFYGGKIG
jgi:pimeloyl-ACP methyl ester carboxylesterase